MGSHAERQGESQLQAGQRVKTAGETDRKA